MDVNLKTRFVFGFMYNSVNPKQNNVVRFRIGRASWRHEDVGKQDGTHVSENFLRFIVCNSASRLTGSYVSFFHRLGYIYVITLRSVQKARGGGYRHYRQKITLI